MGTTTTNEAATRRRLPALQAAYDAARERTADLEAKRAAVAEAPDRLGKGAHPAVRLAIEAAAGLVGPALGGAQAEEQAARHALVAARRDLLPGGEHPLSRSRQARRAVDAARERMTEARMRLAELARNRDRARRTVEEGTTASDMGALAAAEAELRLVERALPAAREAVERAVAANAAAREARAALDRRVGALHDAALDPDPEPAEAALAELRALVGEPVTSGALPARAGIGTGADREGGGS